MVYMESMRRYEKIATLSEVYLKTFMKLIIIQTQTTFETIQFLLRNHQRLRKPRPNTRLIPSTTLIGTGPILQLLLRQVCLSIRKSSSRVTNPTLIVPKIQLSTSSKGGATQGAQSITIPTPNAETPTIKTFLKSYQTPEPLKASNRAKRVAVTMVMVAHILMSSCPHQKQKGWNSCRHIRQYSTVGIPSTPNWTISKQFSDVSYGGQLWWMSVEQEGGVQTDWLSWGSKLW